MSRRKFNDKDGHEPFTECLMLVLSVKPMLE